MRDVEPLDIADHAAGIAAVSIENNVLTPLGPYSAEECVQFAIADIRDSAPIFYNTAIRRTNYLDYPRVHLVPRSVARIENDHNVARHNAGFIVPEAPESI